MVDRRLWMVFVVITDFEVADEATRVLRIELFSESKS
jgi:hypothetical protein